jgi:hypothetical protein
MINGTLSLAETSLITGGSAGSGGVVTVRTSWSMGTPAHARFQLVYKYLFCAVSFVVWALYVVRTCRGSGCGRRLSFEQKWIGVLLLLLTVFDDPFVAVMYQGRPQFAWSMVYAVFLATFLSGMILFWITALDPADDDEGLGSGGAARRRRTSLAMKSALVAVFWALSLTYYYYVGEVQIVDPLITSNPLVASTAAGGAYETYLMIVTATVFTILLLWMIVLAVSALVRVRALRAQFLYIYVITLLSILVAAAGLYLNAYSMSTVCARACAAAAAVAATAAEHPILRGFLMWGCPLCAQANATVYLCFYAMFNFYLWTLAFMYSPVVSSAGATAVRACMCLCVCVQPGACMWVVCLSTAA